MPETYGINARDYSALLKVADDAETHTGNLIHKREACDQDVARNSNWENSFSMLVQPVRFNDSKTRRLAPVQVREKSEGFFATNLPPLRRLGKWSVTPAQQEPSHNRLETSGSLSARRAERHCRSILRIDNVPHVVTHKLESHGLLGSFWAESAAALPLTF